MVTDDEDMNPDRLKQLFERSSNKQCAENNEKHNSTQTVPLTGRPNRTKVINDNDCKDVWILLEASKDVKDRKSVV
jgi:hypothetical protein